MDYKYIEQLIERYFDCMTTIEEEQILRSFFCQEDVPAHLMQYRDIFAYEAAAKHESLGEDFDVRMLSLVEGQLTTDNGLKTSRSTLNASGRIISLRRQLAPLFRAAAIVTVIISVGNIAEHSMVVSPAEQSENAVAISPYTKAVDVESAFQIKDVSRAEAIPTSDSIPSIQSDKEQELRQ